MVLFVSYIVFFVVKTLSGIVGTKGENDLIFDNLSDRAHLTRRKNKK
jgi:hypothetical protein